MAVEEEGFLGGTKLYIQTCIGSSTRTEFAMKHKRMNYILYDYQSIGFLGAL